MGIKTACRIEQNLAHQITSGVVHVLEGVSRPRLSFPTTLVSPTTAPTTAMGRRFTMRRCNHRRSNNKRYNRHLLPAVVNVFSKFMTLGGLVAQLVVARLHVPSVCI
jgi:hypothetical protein